MNTTRKILVKQSLLTIEESGSINLEEALAKDDSFDSIRCKLGQAINAVLSATAPGGYGSIYAYVLDVYPADVIYSIDNKMYQVGYTIDAEGDVQLGDVLPVQLTYTPKASTQESISLAESCDPLQEGAYDPTKGQLAITIIKPGLSKNNVFYSADVLKAQYKMFEGAKMFANHQTDEESAARPEGDVRDWVASVGKTWVESDGTVKGYALPTSPEFKSKLELLKSNNMLNQLGVSIRAMGEVHKGEQDGKKIKVLEAFTKVRSVDFVTFAGAGGQAEDLS